MRRGIDVRVDSNGDRRGALKRCSDSRNELDFRFRFAVEAVNSFLQRETDFGFGFADSGKDNRIRFAAGCQDAIELTAGDDVEIRRLRGRAY